METPNDAPKKSLGDTVRQFVSQYFLPSAIASIVATALSVYAAVNAAHEKQQAYNQKFELLVNDRSIMGAFGGVYVVNPGQNAYQAAATKASYTQSVREEQATATLLSLQSVAESETQRRTVLLIGARLLNADPSYAATGSDAARLLTVLIDEANRGRHSWNPWERMTDGRLWETVTSASFIGLVTAGYENNYYNDTYDRTDLRPEWPTLNGDAPVTHDAKFQVLWSLTNDSYDGWVHLVTFKYNLPRQLIPAARERGAPPAERVTRQTAQDLINDAAEVMPRRDFRNVGLEEAQYALPDPRQTPVPIPVFHASQLEDTSQFPAHWIMLKHRLLRARPPVEYINPDGSFRKGSLGRIIGVVPAGSCVTVVEPLDPVLVFLPTYIIDGKPRPPGPDTSVQFSGLVHMWAHVRATKNDEDCLSTVGKTQ